MTSGQVASIVCSLRRSASAWTAGETPWAEKTVIAPSGIVVVELVDEDRAALAQLLHDVLVVHDLLAHVDRRAVELERALDGLHGAVDAGAVAARGGEEELLDGSAAIGQCRRRRQRHVRRSSTIVSPDGVDAASADRASMSSQVVCQKGK